MIASDERRDRFAQLAGEGGALGCGTKANGGIDRQRCQMFVGGAGKTPKVTDLADDAGTQRDQIACRQPVCCPPRIGGDRTHGDRRHDVGRCGRDEQTFRQPAPSALCGNLHQLARFKRPQVVVDFLPREADPAGERRGGCRLCQFRQKPAPDALAGLAAAIAVGVPLGLLVLAIIAVAGSSMTSTSSMALLCLDNFSCQAEHDADSSNYQARHHVAIRRSTFPLDSRISQWLYVNQ